MKLLFKAKGHFFLCLVILITFIFSCKDPDNVGLEVLPKSDVSALSYSDTFSLQTSVVREDSISVYRISNSLLGAISDNLFGYSNASFYTQVLLDPNSLDPDFGTNAHCDSIVLTLDYNGYTGDITSPHQFTVYRLNESISTDTGYYSNKTFQTISAAIGTETTSNIHPTDSVLINGANTDPHLRITLNSSLGDEFINNSKSHGVTNLQSNSNFLNYFKGIYVRDSIQSGMGAVLYFDLKKTMSKITMYYTNAAGGANSYNFSFDPADYGKVSHFEHNYTGAIFINHLNDPSFGSNLCYIQSMAGIKTKVEFPFLNNLIQNQNISINKAELAITIDNTTTGTYPAHSSLFLVGIDSVGTSYFLPDWTPASPTIFGGTQNSGTYSFFITRYIQQILTGNRKDYGLYIVASGASVNANRTVIGGSNNSSINMKLKLNYTNINP